MIFKNKEYTFNFKNTVNGLDLLGSIKDETIPVCFFDPQYRGVLDKLNYGNEGTARGKARCNLVQMSEDTICSFIREINRVLCKSGHLFLWVDKFHLCSGITEWLEGTDLHIVDMIVWDKCKIGMGYRSRRKSEYLIILQKSPVRAKNCWTDHSIPDVWTEKVIKTHPHSKPVELQKRLIEAVSSSGDIILDPAAGGFSVLDACSQTGRTFLGTNL